MIKIIVIDLNLCILPFIRWSSPAKDASIAEQRSTFIVSMAGVRIDPYPRDAPRIDPRKNSGGLKMVGLRGLIINFYKYYALVETIASAFAAFYPAPPASSLPFPG